MTVVNEERPCSTFHICSEHVYEDLQLLREHGLVFIPLRKCRRVGGFAHRFYDPLPGQPYDVFGVISRDNASAERFAKAYYRGDHWTMGKLLGYPECCIHFFLETWIERQVVDPIWEAAANTTGHRKKVQIIREFLPECNILSRYAGIRVVPHLVCSFDCEGSAVFAEMFRPYIPHYRKLVKLLSEPTLWDCRYGVAIVKTRYFEIVANSHPYRDRRVVQLGETEMG